MTHGSLFSGIGGFDLAAEWMGWENVFHCEINPFCQRVLKHHFPHADSLTDIKTTDFKKYANRIYVLSGGFPCQPYSTAGKRKGTEDDRHLWPEMLRAIREIQPCYVVGENVRGLTNWNRGMVFDQVQADLETQGYEVLPFLLPACAVNAPHRRDRIWFIAYSTSNRRTGGGEKFEVQAGWQQESRSTRELERRLEGLRGNGIAPDNNERNRQEIRFQTRGKIHVHSTNGSGDVTDTSGELLQGGPVRLESPEGSQSTNEQLAGCDQFYGQNWKDFPTQSPVCGRNDGVSFKLAPMSVHGKNGPRLLSAVQTFERWRKESVKAYGNAVVPQVVYEIFNAIQSYEVKQTA